MAISEGTVIEGVHCVPDSVELLPHMPNVQRARLRIVVNINSTIQHGISLVMNF
jgi:hypothetical protein